MEELMQYVWRYRLWPAGDMHTVDGERIEVLDPGNLNRDAGPDFFNAKLVIGGQTWVGNVEMHVRASDWYRHGHDRDHAYDTVVLHVVERDDMCIRRPDGSKIPQMVMTCAHDFDRRYQELVHNPTLELPCSRQLSVLPPLYVSDWVQALAFERLLVKSDRVLNLLQRYAGSWSDAMYLTLARALGFGTNSEPFELLAMTTPLKCMLRNSDSLEAIEAMLFGQSGLLDTAPESEYASRLRSEYEFYATKYNLKKSPNIYWKMARMRPPNFPYRRIAALAVMVSRNFDLSSRVLAVENEAQARELFDVQLQGYWARHYTFSSVETPPARAFSYASATVLLINVVVPVMYAYGASTGHLRMQEQAVELLQSLKPEHNSVVDLYARAGMKVDSAFATQALIQLRREYCEQRKCLFCRIGHKLLSARVKA